MKFIISELQAGKSVLSYLKNSVGLSSGNISSLKNIPNGITVNGAQVTVRYILGAGEVLTIKEEDNIDSINHNIKPVDIPIEIIYEDENLIAVNKPPDMPTHPSHGHTDDTLANALAYIFSQRHTPFVFRAAGRLDRNTSGVVLISKNRMAASQLYGAFTNKQITKRYLAVLSGELPLDGHIITIDDYIKRESDSIITRTVCGPEIPGATRAITKYKVLYSGNGITLVDVLPETGRTHQLRVHFSSIGHPIFGDELYGKASPLISRHALHAAAITVPMPLSKQLKTFHAATPSDMEELFFKITGQKTENFTEDLRVDIPQKGSNNANRH